LTPSRTAVAIALLLAALATAGCGLGPGEEVGEASLTVTRDYGAEPVAGPLTDGVAESDTVMRVLERNAEIETRYGGGFVQAIDGLSGERDGGGPRDWFFYVNGVESPVGAADYKLSGGEAIWWDHRRWSAASRVPAVVGSWPQPFTGGYEGRRRPVAVECRGGGEACGEARRRLAAAGASVAAGSPEGAIRVLVGPWSRVRLDPAAAKIEDGPQASGVFADFAQDPPTGSAVPFPHIGGERNSGSLRLRGLSADGEVGRVFGPGAGLVAATRRFGAPPVWIVSGARPSGVRAAASLLSVAALRGRYAVATEGGEETPLPVR
jgi:hypothetical protein